EAQWGIAPQRAGPERGGHRTTTQQPDPGATPKRQGPALEAA
ncbi:hypothetical protein ABH920_010060, partial [Catenulispora sp. EB89]